LDLDETLIHYVEEENNAYIQIRPYAEEFIETVYQYFELVIFTAAMKDVSHHIIFNLLLYFYSNLKQKVRRLRP
jgi:TFIIF-interacting CTD phosphatase-like protein